MAHVLRDWAEGEAKQLPETPAGPAAPPGLVWSFGVAPN